MPAQDNRLSQKPERRPSRPRCESGKSVTLGSKSPVPHSAPLIIYWIRDEIQSNLAILGGFYTFEPPQVLYNQKHFLP